MNYKTYFLQPGYIFFSVEKYIIETILGSCVSVCLWDKNKKIGGMNHYIYDKSKSSLGNAKYGNFSIPFLVKKVLEISESVENIECHIIGGAKNKELSAEVGEKNVKIAKEILSFYNIKIKSEDTGGDYGRKVKFNNFTGEVNVWKIEKYVLK